MSKFSIIIVSYNGEKYIKNCIDSLKKQTFNDYEILFIDDGSLDNTEKIVKEYKDVRYYKIKHSGVSKARNYGIKKASGKYFLFVDVDDYISCDLLSILDKKTKKDVDLVKFDYKTINEEKLEEEKYNNSKTDVISGKELFNELCLSKKAFDLICIYLYNLEYWNKNKFSFKEGMYHEDFGIIPYVILKAEKVININYVAYFYVQTKNSITRTTDKLKNIKKAYDYLNHFDFLYDKVNNDESFSDIKSLFNSYISNAVILKLKTLDKKERKKYLLELKKRDVFNNIKSDTLVRKVKKTLLKICPNIYLRIFR